jgi:hypothetical protein
MDETRLNKLQGYYMHCVCENERYENQFKYWKVENHMESDTYNTRLKKQKAQEKHIQDKLKDLEEGEIIDEIIEMVDYRIIRYYYSSRTGTVKTELDPCIFMK